MSEHLSPIGRRSAQVAPSRFEVNRIRTCDQQNILHPVVGSHLVRNQNPACRQCKKATACGEVHEMPGESDHFVTRANLDQGCHFRATLALGCSRPKRSLAGRISPSVSGLGQKACRPSPSSPRCWDRQVPHSRHESRFSPIPSRSAPNRTTYKGYAWARDANAG